MLKLLANENVQRLLVAKLRDRGHDIRWVLEESRGIDDPHVLREALSEGRVLLTWDKDFGELVYRQGKSASNGVILLRVFDTKSQAEVVELIVPILEAHESSWPGHFSVIDRSRVRVRPLP
jgi:predicted nuclease of predicted toxin-antitoxin system